MPKLKNGDRLLSSIVQDFAHQRPQMSKKQADELEAGLEQRWAETRRKGLTSLTVNGRKLINCVAGKKADPNEAVENLRLAYSLRDYAERLRSFAVLMDGASTRINLAVRWRDDYEAVAEAARKSGSSQPDLGGSAAL